MRKQLKFFTLILIGIFAAAFLIGCGSKTPKEALIEAAKKEGEIKSYSFSGEAILDIKTDKASKEQAQIIDTFKDAKITYEGSVQSDKKLGVINITVQAQGASFQGSIYVKDKKTYLKLPKMFNPTNKYIVMDLEKIQKEAAKDGKSPDNKKAEKQSKEFSDEIFASISKEKFKDVDKKEVDGAKVRLITLELENKDINDLLKKIIDASKSNKYKDLFSNSTTTKQLEQLKKSMDNTKDVKFDKLSISTGINKSGYANYYEFTMPLKAENPTEVLTFKFNLTRKNINKSQDIKLPDFNNDNTIDYNKVFGSNPLLGGGSGIPNKSGVTDDFSALPTDYAPPGSAVN